MAEKSKITRLMVFFMSGLQFVVMGLAEERPDPMLLWRMQCAVPKNRTLP